jgi:hypothetical protein
MTLPAGCAAGPPAADGGVPADDHHPGDGDVSGQEGSVERAGDWGPQGAASLSILLKDTADEYSGLADSRWNRHEGVVGRVAISQ